ncbi:4345_t:CDS:2, partial [Cetraspora pellucida]
TPSTSKPFKNAYTISVSKHIKRVLSNGALRSQMHFRPGIEAKTKSEFWHENIWQKLPLFGSHSIRINYGIDEEIRIRRITAIISTSNGIKLKIQLLYFASNLPRMFARSRIERSWYGELWLSEITHLIDPLYVIEPVIVWLQDTS